MKYILKIIALLFFIVSFGFSQTITIEKNSYRIVEFDKMIKNIKVSDSKTAEVSFIQDDSMPLQKLKILGKEFGNATLLITFYDNVIVSQDINIVRNIRSILSALEHRYPKVKIIQSNDNIILDGTLDSIQDRNTIIDILKKAGIDTDTKLIDFTTTDKTKKMLRLKLYITEINNTKGTELKNNWAVGYRNYLRGYTNVDATQQNFNSFIPNLSNLMESAVTLTGGLTAGANYLGKNFNVGMTLKYLSSAGAATILHESTILTVEEKSAKFLAGGELMVEQQTINASGIPVSSYMEKEYGIILEVLATKIINGEYIDLTLITKSTQIDPSSATKVGNVPGFKNQSIETNVIVRDGATIVLGGLIKNDQSRDISKVPLLGDIPILGHLFRSKDFQNENSELVFFITPEIVEPSNNTQIQEFENTKEQMKEQINTIEEKSKIKLPSSKNEKESSSHTKIVNDIFGL
ncbi:type II and III secretion system protein family protein [Arcobacter sp. FWKO B]|uniref:type II and III secretion system protein family protein n=1 Tax=Arcobacter sp. FWKO B TaxID=2593672 RepID=UPI0018A58E0D|nr:pilus assembly protein N-terminal domain-containing protein [Arcobacter sp. FWKO B]QOG12536.1 hypothetical protein FWKOB_07390 [Arcobacter sp. FWKO B]